MAQHRQRLHGVAQPAARRDQKNARLPHPQPPFPAELKGNELSSEITKRVRSPFWRVATGFAADQNYTEPLQLFGAETELPRQYRRPPAGSSAEAPQRWQ
jgi:hypothetical protein